MMYTFRKHWNPGKFRLLQSWKYFYNHQLLSYIMLFHHPHGSQVFLQAVVKLKQDFHLDNIVSGAYPFGEYNEDVVDVLKQLGIKICRTTNNTYRYDVDGDLLIYNPTIYYRDPLLKQQFHMR